MANPDQKTILIEQAYEEIKEICNKFQEDSGASDMEVKTLLRELARVWEKENWMELLHQIFPPWHIYLDVFLLGIGLYVYLRITKKINTK